MRWHFLRNFLQSGKKKEKVVLQFGVATGKKIIVQTKKSRPLSGSLSSK